MSLGGAAGTTGADMAVGDDAIREFGVSCECLDETHGRGPRVDEALEPGATPLADLVWLDPAEHDRRSRALAR